MISKTLRSLLLTVGLIAGFVSAAAAYIDVCHTEREGNCTKVVCHKFQGARLVMLDDGTFTVVYYGYLGTVTQIYC